MQNMEKPEYIVNKRLALTTKGYESINIYNANKYSQAYDNLDNLAVFKTIFLSNKYNKEHFERSILKKIVERLEIEKFERFEKYFKLESTRSVNDDENKSKDLIKTKK